MEENYERLGDFIRKKLEAPLPDGDDWDTPDPSVWSQAKASMVVGSASALAASTATWLWVMGIVSVISLGCAAWVYHDLQMMQDKWHQSDMAVAQLNQQLAQQQHTFSQQIETMLAVQDSLYGAVKALQKNAATYTHTNQPGKPKPNLNSQASPSSLTSSATDIPFVYQPFNPESIDAEDQTREELGYQALMRPIPPITEKPTFTQAIQEQTPSQPIPYLEKPLFAGLTPQLPSSEVSHITVQPIRRSHKPSITSPKMPLPSFGSNWQVELGAEVGMTNLQFPITQRLRRLYTVRQDIKQTGNNAIRQGVNLGFSPNGKWWIRTGFGTMRTTFEQEGLMILTYNKQGEYQNARGMMANDLNLIQYSPYRTSRSTISIDLPDDRQLEEGELVDLYFQESQGVRALQIPLEIAYLGGEGVLQWSILAGAQWNQWVFDQAILNTSVISKSRELPMSRGRELRKPTPAKQFISTYGGIGLSYQLMPNWYLRPELTYNVHFLSTPQGILRRTTASDRTFNMSVHYRF